MRSICAALSALSPPVSRPKTVLRACSVVEVSFGRFSPSRGGRRPKSGGKVSGARDTTVKASGGFLSSPNI